MRFFPSAIDDALDTLYEPNAVFGQFLFLFLSLLPLVVLSFLAFLVFSFLESSFPFLSFFVFSLSCLLFPFLSFPLSSFLFFSLFLFSN